MLSYLFRVQLISGKSPPNITPHMTTSAQTQRLVTFLAFLYRPIPKKLARAWFGHNAQQMHPWRSMII